MRLRYGLRFLPVFMVFCVLFLFGPGQGAAEAQAASAVTYQVKGTIDFDMSYECLGYINQLRKSKGLPALTMSKKLMGYAQQRGAELSCAYTHTRPNGKAAGSVAPFWINGENIAFGPEDAEEVFEIWKNSPVHYKNMTTKSFRSAGIVCFEYDGMYCWVNLFSRRSCSSYKKGGIATVKKKVAVAKKYLKKKNLQVLSSNVYLEHDAQMRLGLTGFPDQVSVGRIGNTLFTYRSSDPSVLKVTGKGVLLPQREGTAKITVCAKANKKCKKTFVMHVLDEEEAWSDPDYSDD